MRYKKYLICTVCTLSFSILARASQVTDSLHLDIQDGFLDVTDKAIVVNVDKDKLDYLYHHTFQAMLATQQATTPDDKNQDYDKNLSKIQALKVAYLTSKLNLKVEESQSFWPLYNEYVAEIIKLKDEPDELEKDEKVLEVRKRYKLRFDKMISAEKTNTLFKAEKEFKKLMQETLMMQKLQSKQALK